MKKLLGIVVLSLFLCAASFADLEYEDFPDFENSINDNVITHNFKLLAQIFYWSDGKIKEIITLKKGDFILKCNVTFYTKMRQDTDCGIHNEKDFFIFNFRIFSAETSQL